MIIFIIPAYNEEKNIGTLLSKMKEKMKQSSVPYRIIIVNDGSKDLTLNKIGSFKDSMPITVISHLTNLGVGQVFRSGFSEALKIAGEEDVIITKEADNTSDLAILETMVSRINDGFDVVLASCFAKEGKVVNTTIFRKMLSFGCNTLLKFFFSVPEVNTYSSFYRAYRASSLKKAFSIYGEGLIEEKGFVCMAEMLIKFNRIKLKITEIPMVLKCDLRKDKSKMNRAKTIYGYLRMISREKLKNYFNRKSR